MGSVNRPINMEWQTSLSNTHQNRGSHSLQCRRIFGAGALNNPLLLSSWARKRKRAGASQKWPQNQIRELNLLFSTRPWKTPALQAKDRKGLKWLNGKRIQTHRRPVFTPKPDADLFMHMDLPLDKKICGNSGLGRWATWLPGLLLLAKPCFGVH